jgi:hypothetical protein
MKTVLFPSLTIEGAASGCLNNERVITVSSRTLQLTTQQSVRPTQAVNKNTRQLLR